MKLLLYAINVLGLLRLRSLFLKVVLYCFYRNVTYAVIKFNSKMSYGRSMQFAILQKKIKRSCLNDIRILFYKRVKLLT